MAELENKNQKTLLLLGGSADQVYAIHTARRMGLKTLVVDRNPSSPGFSIADSHAVVSTTDLPSLINLVDEYTENCDNIAGVLVMGSDIPHVVCELAAHLGTPHIPLEAARLSTNKYLMKQNFFRHGIPIPWFSILQDSEDLIRTVQQRGYPLVIKPVDRSGARGVFYLEQGCDLRELYQKAKELSFSGKVMVEEFLPGLQISTETIMWQGQAYTPGFADRNYEKLREFAPNIIENGGWVPSKVDAATRKEVEALVERAALALGVENGVVKGDVVVTPSGPKIIEMATRLSGGDFSESLIPLGCGVNIVEAAITIAIGQTPDLNKLRPKFSRGVVNRYFFPSPGRLVRIDGLNELRNQPWLTKLEFWYKPGDIVPEIRSHADRFGVFVVCADSREEAERYANQVYRTIRIVTSPEEE
ncbi:ATP-grasp domain-containing protein [Desulfolithobacter sp.]